MTTPHETVDTAAIRARADAATMWKPTECEIRRDPPDEDFPNGYVYAPQGACLGPTLVQLGDTYENSGADWEFIAHARTDVPALCAAVDALTAERDALRKDAERLDYLEAYKLLKGSFYPADDAWELRDPCGAGPTLRDAIDNAISEDEDYQAERDAARTTLATPERAS